MRPTVVLIGLALVATALALAGCGGGGSSGPSGYFGYFPEPDETDLPRDAVFAVSASEFAVRSMRLHRWEDRDDDLLAYGRELTRVAGSRFYDRGAGEHVFVPDNFLRPYTRYLLVVDYGDGLRNVWAFETGDWISGRGTDEAARRWKAPAKDAAAAGAGTGKSWRR